MTTRQAVQHAGEISLGVETVQLCSLDDRIQDGRAVTAAIGTEEQKIFARDSYAPQQSLRQIVVDAEPAVVDADSDARRPPIPMKPATPWEGWRDGPRAVVNRRHALREQPRGAPCQPRDCRCVR